MAETIDFEKLKKVFSFIKKPWVIPVVLIVIAILFSTHFRMFPADLPITDRWAEDNVMNVYRQGFAQQINQQYPNLPDTNKNRLIQERLDEYVANNEDQIQQQIEATSRSFKSQFQYSHEGEDYTYLLAIDPYLWYGYGKNYLECGHSGCAEGENGEYQNLRNGRFGKVRDVPYISLMGVWIQKLSFNSIPTMQAFFLIPVVLIGIAIIPAFFLGRKLGGNLGGFFAAMIIALNGALLGRTPAGFSDTDSANIIFPLFIMWFFIEAIYAKSWKKVGVLSVLGGVTFFIYHNFWNTVPTYDFVLGASGIFIAYLAVKNFFPSKSINNAWKHIQIPLGKVALFLAVSLLGMILQGGIGIVTKLFKDVINFISLKQVAVTSLWPNVLTTVAEFNTVPFGQIVNQMGGYALFLVAILGIVLAFFSEKRQHALFAILLAIWMAGTAYSFTKGVRFALLMVPSFAIAFGSGIGLLYYYFKKLLVEGLNLQKSIASPVLIILFLSLLITPIQAANSISLREVPSYNDGWQRTLDQIKEDAEDEYGYITTWWDFGHWFVANDVGVTFDGGDQGERIHWVGKAFVTDNEKESVGILRMLNCGQQEAPHVIESHVDGDTVRAIGILDELFLLDRDDAEEYLEDEDFSDEAIEEILEFTHCEDLMPQYIISSEDMIGKSGVWGHFGSWDFEKAEMYQTTKNLNFKDGVENLQSYGLDEDTAIEYYDGIQSTPADRWIAPWPSYASGVSSCTADDGEAQCIIHAGERIPINIDLDTYNATISTTSGSLHPASIVYVEDDEIVEKHFDNVSFPFSVILIPNGDNFRALAAQPEQANSMFTKTFFYEGHGLEHFELLSKETQVTGQDIYTYKVYWDAQDRVDNYKRDEVRARHILITADNRTEEEALDLIEDIAKGIDADNFKELAEIFSEGPSAPRGGDLGWFGKGVMVPEFEEVAFDLEIGEVSEPVKTQFGYHLILIEDKR